MLFRNHTTSNVRNLPFLVVAALSQNQGG
jgi:hypothetical protein